MLDKLSLAFERLLAAIVCLLLVTLTAIVVVAVVYRKAGASLVWYDEVASVLLAWLTYYGAALAALKRSHIGFSGLVEGLESARLRVAAVLLGEAVVIAFFALVAWVGWRVLEVLGGVYLVSLTWVPVRLTQSVIPIGAVLFIVAQLLSLPAVLRNAREGRPIAEDEAALAAAAATAAEERAAR